MTMNNYTTKHATEAVRILLEKLENVRPLFFSESNKETNN